ncbi:MAG: hypothetical protein ACP5EQ_01505 [Candidatus Cloacimonadia bacterium]
MGRVLQLWSILYKRLIPHVVGICLILLIAIYAIFVVYALEQRFLYKLKERLSELPIFVLYSSQGMEEGVIDSIKSSPLVSNVITVSSRETLQRLEQEFALSGLSQWVKPESLSDYLIIYLDSENYSSSRFQDFYSHLSSQEHVTEVYYNEKELEQWANISAFFNTYRLIPMFFILLISGIFIFLVRRLMKVRQIKYWETWERMDVPHLYKISHLLIEMGIVIIVLVIGVGVPGLIWQETFLPIISGLHYGWYNIVALLLLYFIISLLNLIGYGKKS